MIESAFLSVFSRNVGGFRRAEFVSRHRQPRYREYRIRIKAARRSGTAAARHGFSEQLRNRNELSVVIYIGRGPRARGVRACTTGAGRQRRAIVHRPVDSQRPPPDPVGGRQPRKRRLAFFRQRERERERSEELEPLVAIAIHEQDFSPPLYKEFARVALMAVVARTPSFSFPTTCSCRGIFNGAH